MVRVVLQLEGVFLIFPISSTYRNKYEGVGLKIFFFCTAVFFILRRERIVAITAAGIVLFHLSLSPPPLLLCDECSGQSGNPIKCRLNGLKQALQLIW